MFQMIVDSLTRVLVFLKDVLLFIPRHVFFRVTDTAADTLNGILESPCCTFIADAGNGLASLLQTDVYFYISYFQIGYGLGVVGCALLIRFLIRRLPFIG